MNKGTVVKIQNMYETLHRIARGYETPTQLQKSAQKTYGLPYAEVLEMAYENIQQEARHAVQNIRFINPICGEPNCPKDHT